MSELHSLRGAVEACHGSKAVFFERTPIHEVLRGGTVWEGSVMTFVLEGHPTAERCYALRVDGKITTLLHEGPVDSPEAAVRASIIADAPKPAEAA